MLHKLLHTECNADATFGAGYVPQSDKILWHIPIVMSGESFSLHFQAPEEKGIYPYVCTIPGHYIKMIGPVDHIARLA
jgi:azurin